MTVAVSVAETEAAKGNSDRTRIAPVPDPDPDPDTMVCGQWPRPFPWQCVQRPYQPDRWLLPAGAGSGSINCDPHRKAQSNRRVAENAKNAKNA